MSLMDEFRSELKMQIEGKAITLPSTWAEKRRIMGPPFEGRYSFNMHPWCRELHDSKATWNVSMKSAQAGFTEVGINLALYYIDVLRKNVLYVLPTLGDASDFARSRFNPALRMSPYLKRVFTDANNVGLKMANNTALYIRGSRGDSGLKSIPVATMILDELDEMDQTQIELAMHRLRGQPEKKIWYISTPTVPGKGVSLEYEKSTKEHFFFTCPSCGKKDEFTFPESIKICGDDMNDPDVYKSRIICKHCKYEYKQHTDAKGILWQDDKLAMLVNTGFWHPTVTEAVDDDRRGFKINQLYSATVSAAEIAMDYFKSLTSDFANQEFHKSVLGEPFVGERSQVTPELLQAVTKQYKCKQLSVKPGQKRVITMGIDQGKISYWVICEWFYPALTTDLNASAECRVLDMGRFLEDEWEVIPDRLMHEWQVLACMVDADPNINDARRFARRFPGHVWLNRYRAGRSGKEMTIDEDGGNYAPIATVDRVNWLDQTLGRFFNGSIELPMDAPRMFHNHIMALVRVYEEDPQGNTIAKYKNYGDPDHFGHALNYAEMALPCAASITANRNIKSFL